MWEVRTYYKDLTGARKQKTKRGFAKKSEALEWERNFKLKEDQSISMSFKSFVDIYLTDFKYMNPDLAKKYSKAPDYPEIAKLALSEMVRQTGKPVFDDAGLMKSGVIVRHLLLP